jgi:predicted kinase
MLKTRHREKMLYDACIESKAKMVIDNTNPVYKDREYYISKAKLNRYRIIGYYFSSTVELAIERNNKRKSPVPKVAIVSTSKKLQLPSFDEGFDELYYVKAENDAFSIEEWQK